MAITNTQVREITKKATNGVITIVEGVVWYTIKNTGVDNINVDFGDIASAGDNIMVLVPNEAYTSDKVDAGGFKQILVNANTSASSSAKVVYHTKS